jgi:hypothetical protein
LLLLIDADDNGKISKQEWMKFMEAEFDRLDNDKKGQLDVKELMQSKWRVSHDRQWTNGFGDTFVTRLRKLAVIPVQFQEALLL